MRAAPPRQPKTTTKPASAARHEVKEGSSGCVVMEGAEVQISLAIMRSCDESLFESGRCEIMEGPWRQIMRIRVESMHKLVTGGNAKFGARGSWRMTETDWELVRVAAGSRTTEPFRPQQKMKSGLQAMESMSGESRGRLQMGRWGVFKENENTLPVWEPTIQRLQSWIHGSMHTHRTRQSIVNHAQVTGMSQPAAVSARPCVPDQMLQ